MKTLLFIVALTMGFIPPVQDQPVEEDCDCPPPSQTKRDTMCRQIAGRLIDEDEDSEFGYLYEKTLWEISCADPKKDTFEEAKAKIQCMWNKYKELCACDVSGFNVSNGNILKYAINVKFPDFVLDTTKEYDLDINFKDPVDGLTVIDYIHNEIKHYKRDSDTYERQLIELETVYRILRSRGAKHAHELD